MSANKPANEASNFEVFIRMRPFHSNEYPISCVDIFDEKEISLKAKEGCDPHSFTFDHIFESSTEQQEVYNRVTGSLVDNAFLGINGTVFCYGQTSTGKTYTCIGKDIRNGRDRGLLPRMLDDVLERCQSTPKHIECKVKISMIQIYNQKLKDLLSNSKTELKIRSSKNRGIFIENVTQKYLLSREETHALVSKGIENRTVSYTSMNAISSRSHMLFMVTLNQQNLYTGEATAAKIIFVDLAGSEKISKSVLEGKKLEEAKKINTSLSALGKVIRALSESKPHIPYRDSKLTRLLQESLGGNSITKLIINISPSAQNQQETLSSLRFGHSAKQIKTQPKINKFFTTAQLLSLLNKAQKKIIILTEVIKKLMIQKQMTDMGFKDFVKMYLKDGHLINQSHQSQNQDCGISKVRSVAGRGVFRQITKVMHAKSCSGEISGKQKSVQKIIMPSKQYIKSGPPTDRSHTEADPQLNPLGQTKSLNRFRSTNMVSVAVTPGRGSKDRSLQKNSAKKLQMETEPQVKKSDIRIKMGIQSDNQSILLENQQEERARIEKECSVAGEGTGSADGWYCGSDVNNRIKKRERQREIVSSVCSFNWDLGPRRNIYANIQGSGGIEENLEKVRMNIKLLKRGIKDRRPI